MEQELIKDVLLEFCPKTSFCILCGGQVVHIDFAEITHICKNGNEVVIFTMNGKFQVYSSLHELLNDLPANDFFRVSKSHIVSLKRIEKFNGNKIKINGHMIPMTAYYRAQLTIHLAEMLDTNYKSMKLYDVNRKNHITIQDDAAGY